MRPHMAHIARTMIRKQLANEAGNKQTSYRKYRDLVEKARASGYDDESIIGELEIEKERVMKDIRVGDSIFLQGVANAQNACQMAIDLIISELKGEN